MAFHWPIISRLIVVIYSFGGTRWRIFVIYAKFISFGHAMERPGATEKMNCSVHHRLKFADF